MHNVLQHTLDEKKSQHNWYTMKNDQSRRLHESMNMKCNDCRIFRAFITRERDSQTHIYIDIYHNLF